MATPESRRAPSLRRQLLVWLIVPLLFVMAASAIAAYISAVRAASDAYDKSLLDPALAIAQRLLLVGNRIDLDLPPVALDALRVDATDRVYFSVKVGGQLLAGVSELPPPPREPSVAGPVFYDANLGSEKVRIAAVTVLFADQPVLIQIAETLLKRDRLVRQVLLSGAVPEALFLLAAVVVVWFGVGRGLAPLDELRADIAARSHRDLRPVPEAHAPVEVRPLVQELNDLLARLSASIAAQERFVANAAHQLRTPLAALQAQVDLARRQDVPLAFKPTLDTLHVATRRTARLARQLLTLARVDPSGEREIEQRAVDLADVAKAGMSEWLARADDKHIDLGFELEPAPISGDAFLLQELAANLVHNAIGYTPRAGVVTVRTGVRDGLAVLEVEDNGPGIAVAERDKVFERFHRIKGTPGEGSGLGLAIVREIADRHGAEVGVGTPDGGVGAVFCVRFLSHAIDSAPQESVSAPLQTGQRIVG